MPEDSNIIKYHAADLLSAAVHVQGSAIQDHPLPPHATHAGETSKARQNARKKAPTATSAPKSFAFVNITDPAESGDADRRKFVRRYVRPVTDNKKNKEGASRSSGVAAVGLETGALPFIIMSHPDQGSNAGTKKFVKQNAQKKFRKEQGKGKGQEGERGLLLEKIDETTLRTEMKLVSTTKDGHGKKPRTTSTAKNPRSPSIHILNDEVGQGVKDGLLPSSLWNHLGLSRAIFPIKMTSTEYRMIEYLHSSSSTTKVPPAFMPLWFGLILQDKSSFQGLISLALNHQLRCHKLPTEDTYRQYHSKALQSVRQRLADATQHTSQGLVTSVLMFLIHDILSEDEVRYKINRAGLRSIVDLRGGIASIDHSFEQRIFILVVEVCGAITFNFSPEYYMPDALLYSSAMFSTLPPGRLQSFSQIWLSCYPDRNQLINILSDQYALNVGVVADGPNLGTSPGTITYPIYLLIIRFLHVLNNLDLENPAVNLETSLCIAAIIYLNVLRDAIGDYFTILSHSLVTRLMDAVLPETDEWVGLESTRLWCLVQGGTASSGEDRIKFLDKTRTIMRTLKCKNWDEAVEIVTDFIYVEELFKGKYQAFGLEIMGAWE